MDIPNVRLVIHWQQSASVEDLLQEFGRAGRDRKSSVSVIFYEPDRSSDTGRLKFMADKTVENAGLDERGKAQMRAQRHRQIDQVAAMLKRDSCFREAIRSYFGDQVVTPRRSLAKIILDWVFGTKEKASPAHVCCDYCDREFLKTHGFRAYVATVLEEAK